jgi:hypothetical protein
MAAFSFEGVVHGARRGASERDPDNLMFNVLNPQAAKNNHLQGAADVVQALRLPEMGTIDLPGTGTTAFDRTRVFFFGHSQGSNVGVPAVAVTGLTSAAVLSGAGGYLMDALLEKTSPVDAKAGLEFLIGEELSNAHPVMTIWQTYFDQVDTINYAPLLLNRPPQGVPSKHVFMSWGTGDSYSPPSSLKNMAQAAGLPVAAPAIEDLETGSASRPVSLNRAFTGDGADRTAAVFQYQPDGYDGHFVAHRNLGAIDDWSNFLVSLTRTGTAAVP